MIPASYLFKNAFQKAWYDPDLEAAKARQRPDGGLIAPWLSRLAIAFGRTTTRQDACETGPAATTC